MEYIRKFKVIKDRLNDTIKLSTDSGFNSSITHLYNNENTFDFMEMYFNLSDQMTEYTYMIALDTAGKILGVFNIGHGNISSSPCPIREIIQNAILIRASSFVIVHNHPSGNLEPSEADIICYKKIKEACKLHEMKLHTYMIIGEGNFYSHEE